LVYIL